jgi:hypothetical protein
LIPWNSRESDFRNTSEAITQWILHINKLSYRIEITQWILYITTLSYRIDVPYGTCEKLRFLDSYPGLIRIPVHWVW